MTTTSPVRDASNPCFSSKGDPERPTRKEFELANELRKAKEEIRQLRMHAEFVGQGYRMLAQIANNDAHEKGYSVVVEDAEGDTKLPERLVSEGTL